MATLNPVYLLCFPVGCYALEEEVLDSAPPEIVQFVQPGFAVSLGPGWDHLLDCSVS